MSEFRGLKFSIAGSEHRSRFALFTAACLMLVAFLLPATVAVAEPRQAFDPEIAVSVEGVAGEGFRTADAHPKLGMALTRDAGEQFIAKFRMVLPEEWRVNAEAVPGYCPNGEFFVEGSYEPKGINELRDAACPAGSAVGNVKATIGLTEEGVKEALCDRLTDLENLPEAVRIWCGFEGGAPPLDTSGAIGIPTSGIRVGDGMAVEGPQEDEVSLSGNVYLMQDKGPTEPVIMSLFLNQLSIKIADREFLIEDLPVPPIPMRMYVRRGDLRIVAEMGFEPLDPMPAELQVGLRRLELELNGGVEDGLLATPPTPSVCRDRQIFDVSVESWGDGFGDPDTVQTVNGPVPVTNRSLVGNGSRLSGCDNRRPFAPTLGVRSTTTQAGATPVLTMSINRAQGDSYMGGMQMRLGEYMLGSPFAATGTCTRDQAERNACPPGSTVGQAVMRAHVFRSWPELVIPTQVANAPTDPGDLATFYVVASTPPIASNDILVLPVHLTARDNASGINAEIRQADMPFEFNIHRIDFSFNGTTGAPDHPLLFNSYSCDPGSIGVRFTSEIGLASSASVPYTSTGCENLPYEPELKVTPTCTTPRCLTGIETTFRTPPGHATTRSVRFSIPGSFLPNLEAKTETCTVSQSEAGDCPRGSLIGRAQIYSPLVIEPLTGEIFLGEGDRTSALKRIFARVEGIVTLTVEGRLETNPNGGFDAVIDGLPPLPVSEMTFNLNGGSDALVRTPYSCGGETFRYQLTSHTGRVLNGGSNVEIDGKECAPSLNARLKPRRARARAGLTLIVRPNAGTAPVRQLTVRLGRGKRRLKVRTRRLRRVRTLGTLMLTTGKGSRLRAKLVRRGRRKVRIRVKTRRIRKSRRSRRSALRALRRAKIRLSRRKLVVTNLPNTATREIKIVISGRKKGVIRNPKRTGKVLFAGSYVHADGRRTSGTATAKVKRAKKRRGRRSKRRR